MTKKLPNLFGRVSARAQNRFITALIVFIAILGLTATIWLVILVSPKFLKSPEESVATSKDCASCHEEIHVGWHQGAHSDAQSKTAMSQGSNCAACHKEMPVKHSSTQTASDPDHPETSSFSELWTKQGMPNECPACHVTGYDKASNTWKSDGISCEACHGVIPDTHPNASVPVEKAEENCRTCHTSDRFDWGKWKDSVHFQNDLNCTDCHNPHTTSLKTIGGSHVPDSSLCQNCHKDLAKNSEHSTHADAKVTCIDCHLGESKGNDDFHKMPDHDFMPNIETCNKCHSGQMHSAGEAKTVPPPAFSRIVSNAASKNQPSSSKTLADIYPLPLRFLTVAMVFGVVGGVSLRKSIFGRKK